MASLVTLNRVGGAVQDNVDFNGKKPALKKGSPAAKVVSGTRQTFGKAAPSKFLDPKYESLVIRSKGPLHHTSVDTYHRIGRAKNFFYNPKHTRSGFQTPAGDPRDEGGLEGLVDRATGYDKKVKGRPTAAGYATLGAGATAGGVAAARHRKSSVSKATSDAQIRRRKTASANATAVSSAIGLGAGTAAGAGVLSRKIGAARGNLKLMKTGRKIADVAVPLTLVGGAVSGINGFNNASLQRADARRRQQSVLHKAYDPEYNRQRRNKYESGGAAVLGAGALGGAGVYGARSEKRGKLRLSEAHGANTLAQGRTRTAYQARNLASEGVKNAQFTHDTTTRLRHEADERGLESSVKTARTKDMKRAKTSLEGAKGEYERLSGAAKDARRAQAGAFRKIGQAQKLRRVTRGKTAALGLTGAGLVGGAAYLHNKPKSTSWGRYSPRYRPGS